jgi:hypothetical protein
MSMNGRGFRAVPQSLRAAFPAAELVQDHWLDDIQALGSYWVRPDDTDLQSQLVKYFKEPCARPMDRSCMTAITRAYADMLVDASRLWKPSSIVRVLASGETQLDAARPHSFLVNAMALSLGATDLSHLFFRTEPRKPMRTIDRLGGPEVFRQRIGYVLQDLFIRPASIGGTAIIVDDICNLGATATVYAAALKRFAGVERVYSVNMAAARFSAGKDGWGHLALNIDKLAELSRHHAAGRDPDSAFDSVWLQRAKSDFHVNQSCPLIEDRAFRSLRFLAERERVPCPSCSAVDPRGAISRWLERCRDGRV